MSVCLTILGSGSAGNCAYVETEETRILVDAGFSLRQIRQRLATIGRAPENLTGILITHEHSDHVQGLAALSEKLRIPVYCNRPTREAVEYQLQTKLDCRLFTTGASFEVGDIVVETFNVPHDAQDPVGFLLKTACGNLGFLTDLGHTTKLVLQRVRQAHVLVLETNHDIKMLQDCPHRPWSLKQRILGRHGHLSNEAAADAAEQIMSAELRRLYLGHLSRQCNRPELAYEVMTERLQKIGAGHVHLELTSQRTPCPTLTLGAPPKTSGNLPGSGAGVPLSPLSSGAGVPPAAEGVSPSTPSTRDLRKGKRNARPAISAPPNDTQTLWQWALGTEENGP